MAEISDMILRAGSTPSTTDYMLQTQERVAAMRNNADTANQQKQLRQLDIEAQTRGAEEDTANQPLKQATREAALQKLRAARVEQLLASGNVVEAVEESKKSGFIPPEATLVEIEKDGIPYHAISIPGQKEPVILDPVERKSAKTNNAKLRELEAKATNAEDKLRIKQRLDTERDLTVEDVKQKGRLDLVSARTESNLAVTEAKQAWKSKENGMDRGLRERMQGLELEARKELAATKTVGKGSSKSAFTAPIPGPASHALTADFLKSIDNPLAPGESVIDKLQADGQLGELNKFMTEQAMWLAKRTGSKDYKGEPISMTEALAALAPEAITADTIAKNPKSWYESFEDDYYSIDMKTVRERVVTKRNQLLGEAPQLDTKALEDNMSKIRALPGWEDATDEEVLKALQDANAL